MRMLLCVSDFPQISSMVIFANRIAQIMESEVVLLHVLSPSDARQKGEIILDKAQDLLQVPIVGRLISIGSPSEEILAEAGRADYDLIVVGAKDRPSIGELILGQVARRVVRQAKTSVLVVRKPTEQLGKFLIGTGGSKESEPTIEFGAKLAMKADAEVTLLYVAAAVPSMYAGLERIEETLPELLQSDTMISRQLKKQADMLRSQGVNTHLELRHGVPAEVILSTVNENTYDLIILGAASGARLKRLFMDEVALQVVNHSPRPVVVVR